MLLFLYGEDTYRLQQKMAEIEQRFREIHKSGLNLEKIDVSQTSFQEFSDTLFQQSIFIQKKLFFLENVFSAKEFKEQFFRKIKEIARSENIIVLIEKNKVKKTDKLFRALQKEAKLQAFDALPPHRLRAWVKREFARYKAEIEPMALNKLVEFVGSNLWLMENEIKKIASYTKKVKAADIDLFLKPKIETEIFKTIEAVAKKDKKSALKLLEVHLEKGDNPFYLLSMVGYQFRNLLLVKSCGLDYKCKSTLGLHPFVLKKMNHLATSFTLGQLKKIFDKIFKVDLGVKTGKVGPEEGLRMLIAEI